MAELYNTSWMNTTTNPLDLVVGIGSSLNNNFLIGNLFLMGFFFVFLVFGFKHDFLQVLLIDSFITTIIAIFFAFAEIIAFTTVMIPFTIFIIVLVFYFFS